LFYIINYSIIIPVFNEIDKIPKLLQELKQFYIQGSEIIIIDDGSDDGSQKLLLNCSFIKFIKNKSNEGKGISVRKGLAEASKEAIVIFDGDLELDPVDIKKLMILNTFDGPECVFASRYKDSVPLSNSWDFGNFIFTKIFNFRNNSNLKDSLCCGKSFYKKRLDIESLQSKKFDIDVEIASKLLLNVNNFTEVNLSYSRRGNRDGKKLKFRDALYILRRII